MSHEQNGEAMKTYANQEAVRTFTQVELCTAKTQET